LDTTQRLPVQIIQELNVGNGRNSIGNKNPKIIGLVGIELNF